MADDLYARAGISDLAEFYRTKFVSDEVLDQRYFKTLDRFDIRFARTMWVYDNVRSGSSILELGCGAGMLALLKRKKVFLAGVDLSSECAKAARKNGYDVTYAANLTELPFANEQFDYVVSLDVLGHVPTEQKDIVLAEIKRVLKTDGVTMHGIECIDRRAQKDYDEMTGEELRRFIAVDGHVGLEEEQEHAERFQRFFQHVAWEPRYTLCLSAEEFIKQSDKYGLRFESDFIEYLRGLSFNERRAFDIAMGYVFGKISDLNLHLPKGGLYVFLKASDGELGSFYNEHRDRQQLFPLTRKLTGQNSFCLDRNPDVLFDDGWYEPNMLPPVARWMSGRGRISFQLPGVSEISFDVITHMSDVNETPLTVDMVLNGGRVCWFSIIKPFAWLTVRVLLPEELAKGNDGNFEMELRADRTWQPRPGLHEVRDDREISIAVCNIEVVQSYSLS
ncbi:MAG: methyltransferase domain-containing protein [Pyrinomonadaceae bacterium]